VLLAANGPVCIPLVSVLSSGQTQSAAAGAPLFRLVHGFCAPHLLRVAVPDDVHALERVAVAPGVGMLALPGGIAVLPALAKACQPEGGRNENEGKEERRKQGGRRQVSLAIGKRARRFVDVDF